MFNPLIPMARSAALSTFLLMQFAPACAGTAEQRLPPSSGERIGMGTRAERAEPSGSPGVSQRSGATNAPAQPPKLPRLTRSADLEQPLPTIAPSGVRLWLPRFYRGLFELAGKRRGEHVRILWFGDSHTAADFLTGELRRGLQKRFGNGGPGFVRIGVKNYRHDWVQTERFGRWSQVPEAPTLFEQQQDGVFGLGGMRMVGLSWGASIRFQLRRSRGLSAINWELLLRAREPARFRVEVGNESKQEVRVRGDKTRSDPKRGLRVRASQLLGVRIKAKWSQRVRISRLTGNPEWFGAIGETDAPGVVLDTVGLNGARLRTLLGWNEGTWVGEVAERDPQLIVLAFGTNEVGDAMAPERYVEFYRQVLARLMSAADDADCLLVGPTDRADENGRTMSRVTALDRAQQQIATELGCAYFSLHRAMGGEGSISRWNAQRPQLAARDGIHLTSLGYRRLAAELQSELLSSYGMIYRPEPRD